MPSEEFQDPSCSWQKPSQCSCAGSHWNEGELDTPITERNIFGYETLSTHKYLKDRLLCELTVVVINRYMQEFGFTIPKRDIIVNDVRVRGCGHSKTSVTHHLSHSSALPPVKKVSRVVHHAVVYTLYFFSLLPSLDSDLTLYTLTSVCIFSILFIIFFLRCWQGGFV